MLESFLELLQRGAPLVAVLSIPFALSSAALVLQQGRQRTRRARLLPDPAATWLQEQIDRRGLDVRLEVHRLDGLDAYWPGVGTIGLSEGTAAGRGIHHWSVVAHELGHALNERAHPLMPHVLPAGRLLQEHAWRAFGAAVLVGALFGADWLLWLAILVLLAAVAGSAIVVADEWCASRRGIALLRDDERVTPALLRQAEDGMGEAHAVYAADLVGRLGVLLAWPVVAALAGAGQPATSEPLAPAVWLLVVLGPFLALRTAQVLLQVFRPEPVASDFRLFTVMHREAQWEFLTGLGVLGLILGMHGAVEGWLGVLSVTLAATVALGPVSAIGRAFVLLPLLLLLRRFGRSEQDDDRMFPEAHPDGAAPALLAMYSDPPWFLRVTWLTHLAWIPMVALMLFRLLV